MSGGRYKGLRQNTKCASSCLRLGEGEPVHSYLLPIRLGGAGTSYSVGTPSSATEPKRPASLRGPAEREEVDDPRTEALPLNAPTFSPFGSRPPVLAVSLLVSDRGLSGSVSPRGAGLFGRHECVHGGSNTERWCRRDRGSSRRDARDRSGGLGGG